MTGLQQWTVEKPWLETHCLLGEGPFYEKATKTVRFVDIRKKQLHTVSVAGGLSSLQTIQLDVCPTVTANIAGVDPEDKILLGMKFGVAVLDRKTGEYELLDKFNEPHNERVRSNDGAADPHGRFWLGSMTDFGLGAFQAEGSLFRFTSSSREEFLKDLIIPNSIGWSPDHKTMYFTHSSARQVHAFDYDLDTGSVSNQRLFYQHEGPGEPDGFRVDVDGNIWHAVYGEGRVLKISPQGEKIGEIKLPTRNITCVQFVETELIITTAADGADDAEELSKEYGGAVFRVDVGTTGLELFDFEM
ncbi:Fc.00g108860.m01.CDS01 [Cosmosporella sp. VM-42]